MTNDTTPEDWAINGVPLQTLAYNIASWGGSRQAPPPMRGQNIIIPNRPGQQWVAKVPEGRTLTLAMWVQGCNSNGTVPTNGSARAQFLENYRMLRQLLWDPYHEFTITKKIAHNSLFTNPGDSSNYTTVTGKGQFVDGFQPQMFGPLGATFSVDIFMADPFFYGDPVTIAPDGQVWDVTETILGEARTEAITINMPSPGVLKNNSANITVKNQSLQTASLDVRAFKATAGGATVTGGIEHSGDAFWMALYPGSQRLTASAPGSTSLTYTPRYF